jgi:ferrous iron transport protein B
MRIFLAGNPNVGKSVLFNRLTGMRVFVSNYPGTTVDYCTGYTEINGKKTEIIDVPGVYSLSAENQAEEVATRILEGCGEDDVVTNVLDATNVRRGLYLTFELMERRCPMVMAVNMMDVAARSGIIIDLKAMEEIISIPVVGMTAINGDGVSELISRIEGRRIVNPEELMHESGC